MSASRKTIYRTFVCVPYGTSEQNITARSRCLSRICPIFNSRCRRVRFARFYIVCEEAPLGTPESPPIVSGVSDMHPPDCPNVEETRNPMQTFSRKKCSHFFPTNILSAFPHEIPKSVSDNITYHSKEIYAYRGNSFLRKIKYVRNPSEAYSSWIPLFSHACIISSGHREDCTSPMCALRRKNIQIRD